jgi:hypothetical protein
LPASNDFQFFLFDSLASSRLAYEGTDRFSEAFNKTDAPKIGQVGIAVDFDPEVELEPSVVGLALVYSIGGIAARTVRASFRPLLKLEPALPFAELSRLLEQPGQQALEQPREYHPLQLAPGVAAAAVTALQSVDSGVQPWLDQLAMPPRNYSASGEQARVEAKDSITLAAQMAEIGLPADALTPDAEGRGEDDLLATVINSAYLVDKEEELLPLDLLRFSKRLRAKPVAASMSVFVDRAKDRRLAVFSVNKKPIEVVLGVDLLYWDQICDTFTFVQYKRLEKVLADDGREQEWVYRRKDELKKALDLMPSAHEPAVASTDWRMTATPFWFKFVRGDAGAKLDKQVLKGMYVPADWLRLALNDDAFRSGPRLGFRLTYNNARYIGRNAFTHLVLRGMTGTTSAQSSIFKKVIRAIGRDDSRELVIAIRQEWEEPPTPRPDRGVEPEVDSEPDSELPF